MSELARLIESAKQAVKIGSLVIPGNPVPASRPRVTNWGVFYGKTYTAWRKVAENAVPRGQLDLPPHVPLLVVHTAIGERPRTTKKFWPKGDCDNHVKGPLDVITKAEGWWHDDDQIVSLISVKRFADKGEEPRTLIEIYHS